MVAKYSTVSFLSDYGTQDEFVGVVNDPKPVLLHKPVTVPPPTNPFKGIEVFAQIEESLPELTNGYDENSDKYPYALPDPLLPEIIPNPHMSPSFVILLYESTGTSVVLKCI